jgi:NADPH:quinone reductase-like Zn-dependent oxidoreductase
MTLEDASTLPHAGTLALQGIHAGRPVREGERILLNGASGNVGPFAIQIAKSLGMHVTGVASTAKLDFVRSIGADEVIDYTRDDYTRLGRRWDRILDVSARRSLFATRDALARNGTYTWMGGTTATLVQAVLLGPATSLAGGRRMGLTFNWKPFHAPDVATLVELYESGAVRPIVDRTFTLDEATDALRYLDEGRHRGKVIVTVPAS